VRKLRDIVKLLVGKLSLAERCLYFNDLLSIFFAASCVRCTVRLLLEHKQTLDPFDVLLIVAYIVWAAYFWLRFRGRQDTSALRRAFLRGVIRNLQFFGVIFVIVFAVSYYYGRSLLRR